MMVKVIDLNMQGNGINLNVQSLQLCGFVWIWLLHGLSLFLTQPVLKPRAIFMYTVDSFYTTATESGTVTQILV
jgi:hypothetical protein